MGYELNQLMKRYGLSTRTISPYSGVAAPTALAADATAAQKEKFDADSAAYTAQRGTYDQYKNEFQNRIASTSPYQNSPLFQGQKQNWDTTLKSPIYPSAATNTTSGTTTSGTTTGGTTTTPDLSATGGIAVGTTNRAGMPWGITGYSRTGTDNDEQGTPVYGWISEDSGVSSDYYAQGGPVRHFYGGGYNKVDGGIEDMVGKYDLANPNELPVAYAEANTGTKTDAGPPPDGTTYPVPASRVQAMDASSRAVGGPGVQQIAPTADVVEATPQMTTPTPVAAAPTAAPAAGTPLEALYQKYLGQQSKSAEITAAEKNVASKKDALIALLKEQASKTEDNAPSKSEMYFRLAAALAAPTKTGGFMENVGLAAKELADFQKSTTDAKKAAAAAKLQLMLKTGEIDAQTAEKELANLKESEKERRDTAKAFAMEEFKAGEKKTEKQAELVNADEQAAAARGLKKGTPQFQSYVNELQDRRKAKEDEELAGKKAEAARKVQGETKLNPKEFELKGKLQTEMSAYEEALRDVETAILNAKNAFTGSVKDQLMMAAYKNKPFGKADPRVTATENMKAAIGSSTLQNAASLKGSLSDKDLGFLRNISGEIATSPDARDAILARAKEKLERAIARVREEHTLVSQGKFGIKVDEKGTE